MTTTTLHHAPPTRHQRRVTPWSVSGLRRHLLYKPLASLMVAMLLLPAVSWMGSGGGRSFEAEAQVASGCLAPNNSIIQNYCDGLDPAPNPTFIADLAQLELDAVNAYLLAHAIPVTQANRDVVYQYGRADLRNAIRAIMFANLLAIIQKAPPAAGCAEGRCRTQHEQALYTWFQRMVWKNEMAYYIQAVGQYNAWFNDACHFTLDPLIASAYGLSYDGSPWCGASFSLNALFDPNLGVPATSYFTTYGLKKSYLAVSEAYPAYGAMMAQYAVFAQHILQVVALGGVAGAIAAAIPTIAYGFQIVTTIVTYVPAEVGTIVGTALQGPLEAIGEEVVSTFVSGSAAAIPVAIIVMAIAIGVDAGLKAFSYSAQLNELNDLVQKRQAAITTPPDLLAMANDQSNQGLFKLLNTFLARTLAGVCNGGPGQAASVPCPGQTPHDVASTASLPAHQTGTDFTFDGHESLAYRDWNGATWTVQTWGGWFVQTCVDGTPQQNTDGSTATNGKCAQPDSIIADLFYIDWSKPSDPNNPRDRSLLTAARHGNQFTVDKAAKSAARHLCPANSITGLTEGVDLTGCTGNVTDTVNLVGGNGSQIAMHIVPYTVPTFPQPYYMSFTAGQTATKTIQAGGHPTPTLTVDSSNLNTDFQVTGAGTSTISITFKGDAAAPVADYNLTLKATGFGGATQLQTYAIHVKSSLAITSPDTITGTAGIQIHFLVTTTGPTPPAPVTLTIDDALLQGTNLHFTDNHDGTATISGAFEGLDLDACAVLDVTTSTSRPCGIFASAAGETVFQKLKITMDRPPRASIVGCCNGTTFIAGMLNQSNLFSAGAMTPVAWHFLGTVPSWLKIQDNGNGTAVLYGTPPPGTTGTFIAPIVAGAAGTIPIAADYPVTVVNAPLVLPDLGKVTVLISSTPIQLSPNIGTVSIDEDLPDGLTFTPGTTATISGTPAPGTGGQHSVTLNVDAGTAGTATQTLVLNVYEQPEITSPDTVTMFVDTPGVFTVTTTGYPSVSTHVVPPNRSVPTDPAAGDGMYFTVTGLPASLTAGNLSSIGFATGRLTLQGTPTAADVGQHTVVITAQNGVGVPAEQTLTLSVVSLTGPTPATATTCNGNYNGTFQGNLTVSAGQNCSFYAGGITGNVTLNGGNLVLTHATVTGNLTIKGSSSFLIGQGTSIKGNLTISTVASGSTTSAICGATIGGNLVLDSNTIPIMVGSPVDFCWSNVIGQNATIKNNTAEVTVNDNDVKANLSCTGNAHITGSTNTAAKKLGQCSAF